MSRVLFVDPVAGLAGDMLVAALVHAGASLDAVLEEVRRVPLGGWRARVEPAVRGAFAGLRFVVEPDPAFVAAEGPGHGHDHGHGHGHDHGHHHDHAHDALPDTFPGQPSRAWRDIRALIEAAPLRPRVRERSLRCFAALADAEGRVHGMPADAVTFHEVGAVDSIVDVVAACAALEELHVDRIVCGPLPAGHGRVRTAHGWMPLPAPATIELLRGFAIEPSPWPGEHVTPTGAAVVAALGEPGHLPAMRVLASGTGAGTRDPSTHANVLRVVLGEGDAGAVNEVAELRAQVDDLTGESVPGLLEALFAAGAVDAYVTPILMKKGRTGLEITALAPIDARVLVGDALLRHAGTFGYRWSSAPREVAARRWVEVQTEFGPVAIKLAEREGRLLHAAPEHEDCARAAAAAGVSVAEVRAAALAAWAPRSREG